MNVVLPVDNQDFQHLNSADFSGLWWKIGYKDFFVEAPSQ
jgi:hypothetical protein